MSGHQACGQGLGVSLGQQCLLTFRGFRCTLDTVASERAGLNGCENKESSRERFVSRGRRKSSPLRMLWRRGKSWAGQPLCTRRKKTYHATTTSARPRNVTGTTAGAIATTCAQTWLFVERCGRRATVRRWRQGSSAQPQQGYCLSLQEKRKNEKNQQHERAARGSRQHGQGALPPPERTHIANKTD